MPVIPNQGSTGGGDAVTLTGVHFTGTTGVRYGTRPAASFAVISDSTTATITPSGLGAVPVSVTTPAERESSAASTICRHLPSASRSLPSAPCPAAIR